jgi:MATE family multidrug resistance protein
MVPLGIGSATAVRVGHAVGRGDAPGVRLAGKVGFVCGGAFMSLMALLFLLAPAALGRILTSDEQVIAAAVPLVRVAAMFQLFDGMQVVGAGALRGAGDTHAALWVNIVGYYVIGLPLAALLVWTFDTGAVGLWWGLNVGLIVIGTMLIARFFRVASRPIGRA